MAQTVGGILMTDSKFSALTTPDNVPKKAAAKSADDYDDSEERDGEEGDFVTPSLGEAGAGGVACGGGHAYKGMVEYASASCKGHMYTPGLFKMLTDERTRQMGQSVYGDRSRLLAALQRYRDGGTLTIGVIGASIAAGQGAFDAPAFPYWANLILQAQLPNNIGRFKLNNGAVPGTSSQYMSTCHNVHVPHDADIVVLEYAVSDEEMPMPHMNNQVRRPYERLIRKLLNYPRRPAVILMHAYRWFQQQTEYTGQFWTSSERQHMEFGLYYQLPQLSVKSCCYHHMRTGKEGFQVKRPRADPHGKLQHENFVDAMLKGNAFYFDIVHPDGNTGHRVMGELLAQLVLDAWAQVSSGYNVTAEQIEHMYAPLPTPMLPNNQETSSSLCFIGPAFVKTVLNATGFEWINEGKTEQLPKWGYIADTPGAEINFLISTNTTGAAKGPEVVVEIGFLRSYETMGKFAVQCSEGCACRPFFVDGIHDQHTSQTFLHSFRVSQADRCVISVKVLSATSSGKHKVKLTGLMVTEDPDNQGFNNWAAWDWVSLASAKDPNGVFSISNIARRSMMEILRQDREALRQRYKALYGVDVFGTWAYGRAEEGRKV
ncbi:hypothetical protein HYH03_008218 [Edaphochlamys debaryana]|uniref:SGNH hydrolase-type esterase domain-containing protein n=1 Tax=Edaphochlamys debaryana TaxID=47281 RepID=A0A836BZS5_9CHLO|nr:hypothetical protein HYH03_008218 [Edaphochlamys debaryana]|eukprot:KAG2493704.1 hypothetical protein HYH03_008218 [Edaphochlamys debaryana]